MPVVHNHPTDTLDHRAILQGMASGYALFEVIAGELGLPGDYRFLDVNHAFEMMVGFPPGQIVGRQLREALPDIEDIWVKRFGAVAMTGRPDFFAHYFVEFDRYFAVSASCPKVGQCAVIFNDITEQKRAEQALARQHRQLIQTEAELAAIYQNTPIVMLVINADRRVIKLNQAAAQLSVFSEQDSVGRRVGELFNCVYADSCRGDFSCDRCLLETELLGTLQQGSACRNRLISLTAMNEQGPVLRQLLLSSTPLSTGNSPQALVSIVDVTELATEQSLRHESEDRYRVLVEEGLDGIFIHKQQEIVFANQQVADIFGCTRDELVGMSALDIVAPNYREYIKHRVAIKSKGIIEIDMLRKDGSLFRVEELSTNSIFQGEEARVVALRDVSAGKKNAEDLQISKQCVSRLSRQFETLLDAIADPIAVLSKDLDLLWLNQSYRQLRDDLGCDEDGLTFRQYFGEETPYPVQLCFDGGGMAEGEIPSVDGRTWQVRAYPLSEEEGQVLQVVVIAIDISEKKRLEEDAMRSSRMASLGVLAAGVAHEINNPNALVLYNSDILLKVFQELLPYLSQQLQDVDDVDFNGLSWAEVEQEVPSLLTAMHGGAQRIRRIVDDLRDFSRGNNGDEFAQTDLNQVVRSAVRLVHNTLKKSTDCFKLELAEDLPCIQGDAGRLEQVIINLLLNACQALANADQAIQLQTSYEAESSRIVLQVIDQGEGIAPELLNSVTEPFVSTKRDQEGTGLGLSVSARIVKQHGGRLLFESQPGEGTSVSMVLPLSELEE